MSRINDLIKELCPNGVIYKKYGDVFEIKTGKGITTKEATDDGLYPIISGGTTPMGYYHSYNRDENIVTVSRVGANAGYVNFITEKFYLNDKCFSIIPKDEFVKCFIPKYIYHYTKNIENKIMELQSEGGVPTINTQKVSNLLMPMLPIDVQLEIINILDKFGGLEAELEAELEARKNQYEFWREKLLNRGNFNQQYITLGDIGKVCMCKRIMKNETSDLGDVPFYKIGTFGKQADAYISYDIFKDYKKRFSYPKKGEILVSCSGTIGRSVIFDGKDAYFQDSNIVWLNNDERKILNKFLYYFYQTSPWNVSDGGTIKRLCNNQFISAKVPLYSLEEQKRIVNILEHFDKLINDISEDLTAEIELIRKQYEYYRKKLLSFEELKNE